MAFPTAGSGTQLGDGNELSPLFYAQAAPITFTASFTTTPEQLAGNGLYVGNPAAASNLTLPTVAQLEAAFPAISEKVGTAFWFNVINLNATNAITIVTNTGWTITGGGSMTVALSTSAGFLARKTGAGTWQLYRES